MRPAEACILMPTMRGLYTYFNAYNSHVTYGASDVHSEPAYDAAKTLFKLPSAAQTRRAQLRIHE